MKNVDRLVDIYNPRLGLTSPKVKWIDIICGMIKVERLVGNFQPEMYELTIEPNFKRLNFHGRTIITGRIKGATRSIKLHAKNLQIQQAKINNQVVRSRLHPKKDHLILSLPKTTRKKIEIQITYNGRVTQTMHGLYASYFKFKDKKQLMLATQLEAIHARELFPGVDEPEAKAIFKLILKYPRRLTAISNTPVKQTHNDGHMKVTEFQPTPLMSTYLLAFVIGNIESIKTKSKRNVEIRVFATPANVPHLKFAAEITPRILDFYERYFDIEYPLTKLDLVALPDFAAGAMENWGLITYREETLLVDVENTSVSTKQYVAMVIAHEIAHQWFGNLVTMKWWTELWLNEGFASWIEYLAVDNLFPDWQMWTQFLCDDYARALDLDALAYTHPVEVPIADPAEIPQIFDAISYSKGACVIRMLHNYLGRSAFQKGLQDYLKKFAYSNASTKDLWRTFQSSTSKPVMKFMASWTSQNGFPVVDISQKNGVWRLTQKRFISSPIERKRYTPRAIWPIPISIVGSRESLLFDKSTIVWKLKTESKFPKLNADQTGFYHTRYQPNIIQKLVPAIGSQQLKPEDRLGLLLDGTRLTSAGLLPSADLLELIFAYKNEDNAAVWQIIAGSITDILSIFNTKENEQIEELFKPLGRKLVVKQLKRLGWEPSASESQFDRILRPLLLSLASRFEDKAVVGEALKQFGKANIHPDVRGAVYRTVSRNGHRKEYQKLWHRYHTTDLYEEKRRLATAISQFKDTELIKKNLAAVLDGTIRLQEALTWVSYSFNRHSKHLTWEWVKKNWSWLATNFGETHALGHLLKVIGSAFKSSGKADEIERFFESHPHRGLERNVSQALEAVRSNADWYKRDYKLILDWLKNQ